MQEDDVRAREPQLGFDVAQSEQHVGLARRASAGSRRWSWASLRRSLPTPRPGLHSTSSAPCERTTASGLPAATMRVTSAGANARTSGSTRLPTNAVGPAAVIFAASRMTRSLRGVGPLTTAAPSGARCSRLEVRDRADNRADVTPPAAREERGRAQEAGRREPRDECGRQGAALVQQRQTIASGVVNGAGETSPAELPPSRMQ